MILRPIHRRPIYFQLYTLAGLEFLFGLVYGLFSLTLPILSEQVFLSVALLGVVFALPELVGTFLDIPIGAFAERFGRKRMIFISTLLLAVSAVLFAMVRNPLLFMAVFIFYEIATQAFIIPSDAAQVALTPNRTAGKFNGFVEGLHNLGFSIGPVVAGLIITYNINYPFYLVVAVATLMAVITFVALPFEKHGESILRAGANVIKKDHLFGASIREFRHLGFAGLFLVFIFFIFAFHWGFIAIAEPLYLIELELSEFVIGLIYAGFTLPIFFVSTLVGRYIDVRGAKGVLTAGIFLMALSTLGFAFTQNSKLFFILSLVAGVGDALLLPAIYTILDKLSAYHGKARISGIKVFAESFGYLLGPLVAGFVGAWFGFGNAFLYLGFFILALSIIMIFLPLRYGKSA